jgi:hypothetical protein
MKITVSQLRRIIKEEVSRVLSEAPRGEIEIGTLYAGAGGMLGGVVDKLIVSYNNATDVVKVEVGAGEAIDSSQEFSPDDVRGIMAAIKTAIADPIYSFKEFGKPTKRFKWKDGSIGPSPANLQSTLNKFRMGK